MSRDRLSQARCRRPGLPATVDAIAGSPRFRRGPADQPDATVTTDAGTFRAVVFGQRPVEDAGPAQTGPAQAAGSAITIKPVCPLGEVPVIKNSPRGLPKGNPDRPGGVRGDFGTLTGARSDGPADPACDGVTYPDVPGWCS